MTNFDYVQKTIDLFEDSLLSDSPLTSLEAVAEKIGYSPHHLGRLFQSLCGEPLGRYMLKRRLAEAAERILSGGLGAAHAAASLGWKDYSSFSRACKKEFGVSPASLKTRSQGKVSHALRARPRLPETAGRPALEPVLAMTRELHVTGLVFFMGANEKTFHRPWKIWSALADKIKGRCGAGTYQFSSWTDDPESTEHGIWIHCAVETEVGVEQDPVFFSNIIPASRVLKFYHSGPVETLYETYRRIWEEYLPRSTFTLCGNREYQYYPDSSNSEEIEVCLPVRD